MATNDTKDWSELFDVALFDANRIKLPQRNEKGDEFKGEWKNCSKTRMPAASRNAFHSATR
jgi:hypothetical protein